MQNTSLKQKKSKKDSALSKNISLKKSNDGHFQGQGAERSNLCPLWSDDRCFNAESVCQETMKQIWGKDPKVDINVDALLPKLPLKGEDPDERIANPNPMLAPTQRIARKTL